MSEKSDAWQLVVVGVSDQDDIDHGNSPNPCRDAKTLAEFARCMGFCSEPVVFAERSPVDEDAQLNLQIGLTEKLTEAAKKMRDNNIKKLMVYYAGHGESVDESRTVSVDLDLVLEEAVVSAVEENELQYVCVIVLLDSCRNKADDSPAYKPRTFPSESNTYVYVYFCELYYPVRNSSLVPAALMHMIQAHSDCTISDFLLRMSQLLLQVTLGRINMEWAGLSRSKALWPFFPAGRRGLLVDREEVDVMPQEHYDALLNTFRVYGCLDCIIDHAVSLPMMLKDTKAMLKDKEKQLSASKPTLRHAIPSYGCLDCIMDCAMSLPVMLKGTKLKNVEADPEILREDGEIQLPASPTLRHMISELRSIAASFFAKRHLFLDDWRRELEVAMCESLEEVKETLEKVTQEPGPSASFSHLPRRVPDSLRRCVLNARRDFYRRHQREGLMQTDHVIEVLQTLECYFDKLPLSAKESLEIQEVRAEEGREDVIPVLYAFVINGISASGIPEQQLRDLEKIVDYVDGKDVVKYGSRFFLGTSSLWIILQSAKLDDKTFRSVQRQLEAWTKQLRQSRAAWHAARLQVVPRPAVPAGLQKLVHELCAANLATGPVVQLTADKVSQLVQLRRGVNPSQLHVFEGFRSASGWLRRGELSFTQAKDWKVLMQDIHPSLSESLQNLAEKTCGRQLWGDSLEFQGAAFLLHRRAHLVSAELLGLVSNAAVAKSPEEFLKWVIEETWSKPMSS
ncbi:unnamed protein product [Effrenium voratum]|nr:unnamed protein product [Effrenium voratum]